MATRKFSRSIANSAMAGVAVTAACWAVRQFYGIEFPAALASGFTVALIYAAANYL